MLAVAFRQLLGHVSNSENDNTLPIKDNTVLYDTVCYNTSNKDKRRTATETATEWLNSGSSQSSWQQATSDSAYPPTHLTHSHIILPTHIHTHICTVLHVIQNSDLMNTPTTTFQVVF